MKGLHSNNQLRFLCIPDYNTVINGKAVGWEAGNVPVSDLDRLPKGGTEGEVPGAGNVTLPAHLTPLGGLLLQVKRRGEAV